jgi:ectoine hydroxylase-related dioxygenase (phytanoyl-CoA dioxygenase family)
MTGLLFISDAIQRIQGLNISGKVKFHALEVLNKGYTVIPKSISNAQCEYTINQFRHFERTNSEVFGKQRDINGNYPRIVNLHLALDSLSLLFTRNNLWLEVQDLLFGAPTSLYTSLFYEVGSQQPLHRDTPVFSTRPEYLYFGTTVYLEPADDSNGCLEVMEYGHKLPELNREAMAVRRYGNLSNIPPIDQSMWSDYQDNVVLQGRAAGLEVKRLHVSAGDSLIWHPQLPHGGSAISNKSKTRYSLVMHTTPVGVPVYHQNAFFNPMAQFPDMPSWTYKEFEGRKIANVSNQISFGTNSSYPISQFLLGHASI